MQILKHADSPLWLLVFECVTHGDRRAVTVRWQPARDPVDAKAGLGQVLSLIVHSRSVRELEASGSVATYRAGFDTRLVLTSQAAGIVRAIVAHWLYETIGADRAQIGNLLGSPRGFNSVLRTSTGMPAFTRGDDIPSPFDQPMPQALRDAFLAMPIDLCYQCMRTRGSCSCERLN